MSPRLFAPALLVLGALGLPTPALAQSCDGFVVLREVPSGPDDFQLRTPDGAPVLGSAFSLRVEGATPNRLGLLVVSPYGGAPGSPRRAAAKSVFEPVPWGLPFAPGPVFATTVFATNAMGESVPLSLSVVAEELCGEGATIRALVFDPQAPGVLASNAVRVRVGGGNGIQLPGARQVNTGSVQTVDLILGDFDEDGLDDVVVLERAPFLVRLRPGADLTQSTVLPAGLGSQEAAVGHFDGDGHLDLAVANLGSDDVSILFGDGDGTFQRTLSLAAGDAPFGIAVGDLDGDGFDDVAVANALSLDVTVLISDGDGTFQAGVAHPLGAGVEGRDVVIADWDGDGALDLAASTLGATLHVFLGNGDGTFDAPLSSTSTLAGELYALEPADLDEDGIPDLVQLRAGPLGVTFQLGLGDGTFGAQQAVGLAPSNDSTGFAVADLTRDGHLDVMVGYQLFPGNGNGTFASALPEPPGFSFPGVEAHAVGDTDGNGEPDLVSADSPYLFVFNAARGGLAPIRQNWAFVGESVAADVNGDSLTDLVSIRGVIPRVLVELGQGDGTFSSSTQVTRGASAIHDVDAADLDGDGSAEFVAAYGSRVDVFRGGTFAIVDSVTTTSTSSAHLVDTTQDGAPDLVLVESVAGQPKISTFPGNGDGTFGARVSTDVAVTSDLVLGDLDGDGVLDVVHEHFVPGEIAVQLGAGNGTFSGATTYSVVQTPALYALGDFDGDGDLDLLVSATGATAPRVSFGNGDGTFQPSTVVPTSPFPAVVVPPGGVPSAVIRVLDARDLDDDGLDDIVLATARHVRVLQSRGDGTFEPARSYEAPLPTTASIDDLVVADVDTDGIPDVLALDAQNLYFSVFLNLQGE